MGRRLWRRRWWPDSSNTLTHAALAAAIIGAAVMMLAEGFADEWALALLRRCNVFPDTLRRCRANFCGSGGSVASIADRATGASHLL